ncbi:MAG: hypothetical protein ACLTBV_24745 [Enterocloster bolteae]
MSYDGKGSLGTGGFFRAAGAGSRDEIAGFAYIRRFGKGAHVFYDREESTCLYFLVEEWRPCIRLIPWERKGHICLWAGKSAQ